jgi:hypothetical protein
VRQFQIERLGRTGETTLLGELLPLPCPSLGEWPHRGVADLPWLANKRAYRNEWLSHRQAMLRKLIDQHRPRHVVFAGASALRHWRSIAGDPMERGEEDVRVARRGDTTYLVVRHPASFGVSLEYYQRVGQLLSID